MYLDEVLCKNGALVTKPRFFKWKES